MPYYAIYILKIGFWKTIASTLKFIKTKFHAKTKKTLNFGKNAFWLHTRLNFEELLSHLTFSNFKYVIKQYFTQNKQFSNLEPKMSYLCNFRLKVWKVIAIIEISTLEFIKMQSFLQKWKFLNVDQVGHFWAFLDWNLKKLMIYLKSSPSSLSKYQKLSKTKTTITATTKDGTKKDLFGYVGP